MRYSIAIGMAAFSCLATQPAQAIPAFARKYGTSCTTCHTAYPKLSPFGEAFRRNGFRFPGTDSDYIKQDSITLRPKGDTEAATLPAQAPLALGFNGQAVIHPDKNTSAAKADNGAQVIGSRTIAEGHLWAGGSFSETATFFAELTATSDGTIDVEHAQVHLNDLVGPAHLVNLRIGRGYSNVSSFGRHSSFIADALMPATPVSALNGATGNAWQITDPFNGVEVSGVVAGWMDYSAGWNAGSSRDSRSSEDFYGHLGFKMGGMRLDGEGGATINAERPWEETAVTLDVFAYHARSSIGFAPLTEGGPDVRLQDTANAFGGSVRAQWGSLELTSGAYLQNHLHARGDGTGAIAIAQHNELSYIVSRTIVPAVRVELTQLRPDAACGGGNGSCPIVRDVRIMPGVALVPYPNLKFTVAALLESANGAPPGGWGGVGGFAAPLPGGASTGLEFQNLSVTAMFAF